MAKRIEEEFNCVLDSENIPGCKLHRSRKNDPFIPHDLTIYITTRKQQDFLEKLLCTAHNNIHATEDNKKYLSYLSALVRSI